MSIIKNALTKDEIAFLENSHNFAYDFQDPDEKLMREHSMSAEEILYITWCRHIFHDVVNLNKSKIIGIGGTHRSGKSIWACTQGIIWDSTFFPRMKYRVVHTPQAFAEEVKYVKDNNIHGAVFVIDEGGVVTPSDSFYEEWYKQLNQSIQVMGYLNPIIIFCAVIRDNVGAKFRKLYNIQIKAKRFNNMFTRLKIYELNYDDLNGKTFTRRPIIRLFGKKYVIDSVRFGKPPSFISEAYKAISLPAKDKLLDKVVETQRNSSNKPKTRREAAREEQNSFIDKNVKLVIEKFDNLQTPRSKPGRIVLDAVRIQDEFKTTAQTSQILKRRAEDYLNLKTDATTKP